MLEQWRADHAEAVESAKDRHKTKATAKALRASRSAQEAHAMLLLPELLEAMKRNGTDPEVIDALDLGQISRDATKRFGPAGQKRKRAARWWLRSPGPPQGPR